MLSEEMANEQGIEVPGIGRIQMTEDSSESVIQSVLPMVSGFQMNSIMRMLQSLGCKKNVESIYYMTEELEISHVEK